MITIILNGEDKQIQANISIEELLQDLGLSQNRLAVEINHEIISRSDFGNHVINDQDKIEIVHAIGGGSN